MACLGALAQDLSCSCRETTGGVQSHLKAQPRDRPASGLTRVAVGRLSPSPPGPLLGTVSLHGGWLHPG